DYYCYSADSSGNAFF
nr:immunoglobulin light chain junction region [Macaca mulatta]MOW07185.1 immunoglobulin light chain junction region [Macaca mulatta]MOW07331.1 immunoglobulin light chain junction region [Macaca mulatta]MOW07547.1 immunoglobulin light chain junction region [Macaca mulatta]